MESSPLVDALRFLGQWAKNPRMIGAVAPSGPYLARKMASHVDLAREGPIVELGPGTGPVTQALLARGVPRERLLLVEYDSHFCELLAERYPGVKIVQGDAYHLTKTLDGHVDGPVASVVSSLPLLVMPEADRIRLLKDVFLMMGPQGTMIQFTYGPKSPMPLEGPELSGGYTGSCSAPIILNIPPARVWLYRSSTA
jgi:phosphatidylethanolamine/phosphatidyl-N-methylethanolamine N-methyltransferase